MKNKFAAIFFDNDGILVDTEKFYAQACDEISRDLFNIPFSLEQYQEYGYTKGIGISGFLREMNISSDEIINFTKNRDKKYEEYLSKGISPMDGVVDFLDLISREKIPTACVTAAPRRHFLQIHEQTGLTKYFKFWVTNEDVVKTKPSPEAYLLAAKKMGVSPKECLVIEDSPRGIWAAKSAGMTAYSIPTAQTKTLDLSSADRIFAGFPELMDFWLK